MRMTLRTWTRRSRPDGRPLPKARQVTLIITTACRKLGICLYLRFRRDGDAADIDAAIEVLRPALAAIALTAPGRARVADELARVLRIRFGRENSATDLNDEIDARHDAISATSPDDPDYEYRQAQLGMSLYRRFERDGDIADLDAAIAVTRLAAATTAPGPEYAERLVNLGAFLCIRYEQTGNGPDLDAAIETQQRALAEAPRGHPDHDRCQSELAISLHVRFQRDGDTADLDAAITACRLALADLPATDPDRPERLGGLGIYLYRRFNAAGDAADLEDAIEVQRQAVAASPDDPRLAGYLMNLGVFQRRRFERTGNEADLDAAVEAAQRLVLGPGSPDYLAALASVMHVQFDHTGDPAALEAAVQAGRRAVALTPPGTPDHAAHLSHLSTYLMALFDYTGNDADLGAAVDADQQAVALTPPGSPHLAARLSGLGVSLRNRFAHTGNGADLDAAVDAGQRAVALTPPGSPSYAGYLSNLGLLLSNRFDLRGAVADLDAAIDAGHRAMAHVGTGEHDLPDIVSNLGVSLMTRFEFAGEPSDLDAAIDVRQRAVALASLGDQGRPGYLSNLGTALLTRFERTGDRADLDAAVEAGQRAVALTPPGSPHLGRFLLNLSPSLLMRFTMDHDDMDLEASVEAGQRAVALLPPDHKSLSGAKTNLAIALFTRYRRTGALADLDRVIEAGQRAITPTLPDSPELASHLTNLGAFFQARLLVTQSDSDLDAAVRYARQATELRAGTPQRRLVAARGWGRVTASAGRVSQAAQGFAAAVGLLPEVVWHGLERATKAEQLAQVAGLAADAAACAVLDGRPRDAVELIEQGRSILWTQALNLRSDLSVLEQSAPDLAHRLDSIRQILDTPSGEPGPGTPIPPVGDPPRLSHAGHASDRELRRRMAREWDSLLAEVRAIEGFSHFLAATPYGELAAAAAAGPVVILNSSAYGSHALVMDSAGDEVRVVELPGMNPDAVVEHSTTMQQALTDTDLQPDQSRRAVLGVLGWLWDKVAEPVLAALENVRTASVDGTRPRVWWCLTGPLNLLPIHAAGHYPQAGETATSARCVSEHVISSYAPSLTALIRARQPGATAAVRHLSVGVSAAPGLPALPAVPAEMKVLGRYFPPGPGSTQLTESGATRDAVLAALETCSWVHVACHASQQQADPEASGFALWDRPLTITDLAAQPGGDRDLAFLSACQTAAGSIRHLDEAIHLGAAMQFHGYRHVIATMWSIADAPSPYVADRVYALLKGPGGPDSSQAAEALQVAVDALREASPANPLLWAPYIHLGPSPAVTCCRAPVPAH